MELDIDNLISIAKSTADKILDHLKVELTKIRAGKASPAMLDGIKVDYYGTPTLISQVANMNAPDGKTISIQPWEKNMLAPIEQAIFAANIGLTPMNDGEFIRIVVPALTEERRVSLVKQSKAEGENAKISLRNERHKWMDLVKNEVKDGYPEDQGKKRESEIDSVVKSCTNGIDTLIGAKEKDILTV